MCMDTSILSCNMNSKQWDGSREMLLITNQTNHQIMLKIEDAYDLANKFDLVVDICEYTKEISVSKAVSYTHLTLPTTPYV